MTRGESPEGILTTAARKAYLWPVEASQLYAREESLTTLPSVTPKIAKLISGWIGKAPSIREPDPIRQEFLTLSEAKAVLAKHPAWRRQIRGDLQMHSTWSDGGDSISQMAASGIERGYQYIGITDHTAGLKVANGLDAKRLAQQSKEINHINATLKSKGIPFQVLHSVEVNLSPSGQADMTSAALGKLDLVLGSFHSHLKSGKDETARYVAALGNPHIDILGHPQTRRFHQRLGMTADWSHVFAKAAAQNKAVEIDGYYERQDLRLSLLQIARQEGALISLGSDAHHAWQLEFLEFALATACLAKIPKSRIINFWPADKLKEWSKKP